MGERSDFSGPTSPANRFIWACQTVARIVHVCLAIAAQWVFPSVITGKASPTRIVKVSHYKKHI